MTKIDGKNDIQPQPKDEHSALSAATRAIHADDSFNQSSDVAPPLHVSSTFRYAADPDALQPVSEWGVFKDFKNAPTDAHIYSRLSAPTTTRLEAILSSMLHARAITYTSGLAAFHALLVHLNPKRIAIGTGYHGCHGVISIMSKLTGLRKLDLHGDDSAWDAAGLGAGDIVHVETPLNPTGEAYDLSSYAKRAHARGAFLTVDSTFGPPGLQDPFKHGADAVMHSGTKYIGGHSDMLCGVLAVQRDDWWWNLYQERLHLGSVMGSLEGWLGIRSLRTLELRVRRQSQSAGVLVGRIHASMTLEDGAAANGDHQQHKFGQPNRVGAAYRLASGLLPADTATVRRTITNLTHASLQAPTCPWLDTQMPNGYGPVFSVSLGTAGMARRLPSKLHLFQHATSLGGVESLIEWRRMSDAGVDGALLRVSVGIEEVEDLWKDLVQGLGALVEEDRA